MLGVARLLDVFGWTWWVGRLVSNLRLATWGWVNSRGAVAVDEMKILEVAGVDD
jgi:hypothetical protein